MRIAGWSRNPSAPVASDFGEPDNLAVVIANCIEDGECPEASAVLADAPAFALEPAFGCGYAESPLRKALILILAREEDPERAANVLVCEVSLQALGTQFQLTMLPSRSIV
jgi:hypothetical protein